MTTIFTIGYEGSSIIDVLSCLKEHRVQMVVDIRDRPFSRKPGFSKKVLQEALEDSGIEYWHVGALGGPAELRRELRESGDWEAYSRAYDELLEERSGELEAVAEKSSLAVTCLLCFEMDHRRCHRSLVTHRLIKKQLVDREVHLKIGRVGVGQISSGT